MIASSRLALDASILIEMMAGSQHVESIAMDALSGRVELLAARLSLTEALYVACRLWGRNVAWRRARMLLDSGYIEVVEDERVWELAAECKCRIPIALGDCYTLAAAKLYNATPVFLREEKELVENASLIEEWLGTKPLYILSSSRR